MGEQERGRAGREREGRERWEEREEKGGMGMDLTQFERKFIVNPTTL